jgi:glycosyltransferase involved in cell wall biosynthesis
LAEKVITLLKEQKKYKKIAKNGRTLIEENYSWKKIAKDLEEVYKGVIA